MKPWIRKGLLLATATIATQTTSAQGRLFDFFDLLEIDRAELLTHEVVTDPPVVREDEVFLPRSSAPPSPDQSLARPVSQLGLDAAGWRRVPGTAFATRSGVSVPLVELSIAGNRMRLAVVEQKTDRDFDAIHYTLLSTHSDDYARLTVSRSGPEIVGDVSHLPAEMRSDK